MTSRNSTRPTTPTLGSTTKTLRSESLNTSNEGKPIDYSAAIDGGLVLLPQGEALEALAGDYSKMIEDGLFLDTPPEFSTILERCRSVQERANKRETHRR
jgi:hypothetical protein